MSGDQRETDGLVSLRIPAELIDGDASPLDALDRLTAATKLTNKELAAARAASEVDSWVGEARRQ